MATRRLLDLLVQPVAGGRMTLVDCAPLVWRVHQHAIHVEDHTLEVHDHHQAFVSPQVPSVAYLSGSSFAVALPPHSIGSQRCILAAVTGRRERHEPYSRRARR